MNRLVGWTTTGAIVLVFSFRSTAHELDHFNVPHGRAFADVGGYLTEVYHANIVSAVRKTNARITACIRSGGTESELRRLQSPFTIADAVCRQFPTFVTYIQDLEAEFHSPRLKQRYPGLLVAYWPTYCIYDDAIFPLDPRQFYLRWRSSVLLVDGHYLGTDKIGHFLHNGWNYFLEYHRVLRQGGSEEDAMRSAVLVGAGDNFLLSERGMLGLLSSGVISNADLAANYMGLLFYLNLTQPVMLQGESRPPMLELREKMWHVTDRVRKDSDFFVLFFSDHWDEAMNANLYDAATARAIRDAIEPHCERLRMWYVDQHGEPLSRRFFEEQASELQTYYGQDYGHTGVVDGLVSTMHVCFSQSAGAATALERLHAAAMDGDVAAAERAMADGAKVDGVLGNTIEPAVTKGTTALHVAASHNHPDVVRLLLDHGASVGARTVRDVTALHVGAGNLETADLLIAAGADVNAQDQLGRPPVFWAARQGTATTVERLLDSGADPDRCDIDGETALHVSSRWGHAAVAQLLVSRDAAISASARYGTTPLHLAARYGRADIAQILMDDGADVRAADEFGCQPLHEAALWGNTEVALQLLGHGADVHARDLHGRTPMDCASRRRDRLLVEHLATFSGKPHAIDRVQGGTPGETRTEVSGYPEDAP